MKCMPEQAKRRLTLVLLLTAGLAFSACDLGGHHGNQSSDPCSGLVEECTGRLSIGGGLYFPYLRTHALDRANSSITRVLILVHGAGRAADWNFETGILAARAEDRLEETLVIAPRFQILEDVPEEDEAYWTSSGWKRGHLSVDDGIRTHRVSSYAVMDGLLHAVTASGRFPNLEAIVVAGHSAGGQYTHRYAAGNRTEDQLGGIPVRYVVANPSTYLYIGPERAVGGSMTEFAVPQAVLCPDYNTWHYGLEGRNTYMSVITPAQIGAQMVAREVVIMVGDEDQGTSQLDMSCGAMLQGIRRFQRGITLFNYMNALHPGHHHTLLIIQGVAHSSRDMFTSEIGLGVLFNPVLPAGSIAGEGR